MFVSFIDIPFFFCKNVSRNCRHDVWSKISEFIQPPRLQGDAITIADICLASQMVGAGFFKYDTAPFPTARRIFDTCMQNDAFARAHPLKQPGAPASV